MDKPPGSTALLTFWTIGFLAVTSCLVTWAWIAQRLWRREPVLPYRPRRPVPWRAIDLLLILGVYVGALGWMLHMSGPILGTEVVEPPLIRNALEPETGHPIVRLLSEGKPWMLLVCAFSAALVAPIFEEFLFRVLVQGWLEAAQRRWRRRMPTLRRLFPGAAGPILLTSLLFAGVHFRVDSPPMNPLYLAYVLMGQAVMNLLTLGFALFWLRTMRRATAADFGWRTDKLASDVRTGVIAFLAFAAPIYALQSALIWLLPGYMAVDPATLFLLALVLGTLYYRTHRVTPSIVVHMCLNATSLAAAWLIFVE